MVLFAMTQPFAVAVSTFPPISDEAAPGDDDGPIQVGYAVITPSATTSDLVVFETFGQKRGNETTQAGVLPSGMTRKAVLFVATSGKLSRNLGVAIANPGNTDAKVTMTLKRDDGMSVGTAEITVMAKRQTAQFVTQMFADQSSVPQDLTGSLTITSDFPVAVIGLRFRGANFSTLPITNQSAFTPVPDISTGVGGASAVLLPHFASGGGWASEIVIANTGSASITVRVDLFKQDGSAYSVKLDGETKSSFTDIAIPAGGVHVLTQQDNNGNSPF